MNQERLNRVMAIMERRGLDQMLLTDPYSILYLTGKYIDPDERMYALYLNRDGGSKLFVNSMFSVPEDLDVEKIRFEDSDDAAALLCRGIDRTKPLGIDKRLTAGFLLPLIRAVGIDRCVIASNCVDEVRSVKDQEEQDLMREASRVNDQAMGILRELIHDGVTEYEIEQQLLPIYRSLGAQGYSFEPSVCFGRNTAEAHHEPDGTVLQEGDAILLDVGCVKDGYCSDMTRVFFYKKLLSEEHQRIYETARKATEAAEAICRPGMEICEADAAAHAVIDQAGYGDYFNYRTGHFIGLEAHEAGDVSSANHALTVPGNVFSIEPGIFLEGNVGISIEDLVLITEDGAEVLNHYSHDLDIIE